MSRWQTVTDSWPAADGKNYLTDVAAETLLRLV